MSDLSGYRSNSKASEGLISFQVLIVNQAKAFCQAAFSSEGGTTCINCTIYLYYRSVWPLPHAIYHHGNLTVSHAYTDSPISLACMSG